MLSRSVLGRCGRDLLVQLYLQRPDLRVPLPDVLLHSQGAAGSSVCKVRPDGLLGRLGPLLGSRTPDREVGKCFFSNLKAEKESLSG